MTEVKEFGEVIEVQDQMVKVKMKQHATCSTCGHKGVCFAVGKERVLLARAGEGVRKGDMVSIFFPSAPSIISSLLIFVGSVFVPLAAWLVAEMVFKAPILIRVIVGVGSLVIYWIFLIFLNRRLKRVGWFLPRAYKSMEELDLEPKEAQS